MRNFGLEEAQAGIKIAGRNVNNLRYMCVHTHIYREREIKEKVYKFIIRRKKL